MRKKNVLTIAGSDPGGGAGIQADIKAFQTASVHGLSVITCITSQNTCGVKNVFPLPLQIIDSQLDVLFDDFSVDAVKTGMLYNRNIVKLIAKKIDEYGLKPVVDPILKSGYNDALSTSSYIGSLKKLLIPKAFVLTANIDEASFLADMAIKSIKDMKNACQVLYNIGSEYVVIKGGHLEGEMAVDIVYDGKTIHELTAPRYPELFIHGSGCNFAALITAYLPYETNPLTAIKQAKQQLWNLYTNNYSPGSGASIIDYQPELNLKFPITSHHAETAIKLQIAIHKFLEIIKPPYIPEVGINFCYALPKAQSLDEICSLDGRILKTSYGVNKCGKFSYGASKHIARIVLTAMHHNQNMRAALNLAYSPETIKTCKKNGLTTASFSRKNEPPTASSSMEWGTKIVIEQTGTIPDVIYDTGGIGKEAMIRILGTTPNNVIKKVQKIIK